MNTIQEEWDLFAEAVVPEENSPILHREMKRAFYAGAGAALYIMLNGDPEDTRKELLRFCQNERDRALLKMIT